MRKYYGPESSQAAVPGAQKDPDEICYLRKAANQIEQLQKEAEGATKACVETQIKAELALEDALMMLTAAGEVEESLTSQLSHLNALLNDALNNRNKASLNKEKEPETDHRPEEGYSHE